MKKKSTKSALLMSFTSLLLCFAMLIGCTFAWFTDTVTSGVNKIVAGNLDVEVQYTKDNGAHWHDLASAADLFQAGLWEPGHTEYVTLKIENKGTLAMNYKMMVTPVTEKGGVNVSGQSFKLSDYLMFGATDPADTAPNYGEGDTGRTAARAAVTTAATGLNQANLTQTGTMMAGNSVPAQYITLVVYMPDTVGNDANYKTGTAAPEIELGITVVATQLGDDNNSIDVETDSFGDDYDVGAVSEGEYHVGPAYAYWPQVAASATVAATGDTVITATGKLNSTDSTNTELAKVTVPADAVASGVSELTVSVKPVDATDGNALTTIQAQKNAGQEVVNFDIKVEGIEEGNTKPITVEVFVGTGLNNVKAFHNGAEISDATYNSTTGKITFTTTSFSDYTVSYDQARAAIGSKTYGTLALAVAAAENGDTVILLKDCAGDGIVVADSKFANGLVIDLNGKTYTLDGTLVGSTGTETNGFQLLKGNKVTIKNGKIAVGNNVQSTASDGNPNECRILIQNYSDLTLNKVTLDGRNCKESRTDRVPYVLSNNSGTVAINNSEIIAGNNAFAFDSCKNGNYVIPTVTVTNSTIRGKIEISGGTVILDNGARIGGIEKSSGTLTVNGKDVDKVDRIICTAEELKAFAAEVNGGNDFNGKTIVLMDDINLKNVDWTPIGNGNAFNGVFEGCGFTVSNLNVSGEKNVGLFGYLFNHGTIRNLNVENADVTGVAYVGVVAGAVYGDITNCHVENATVTAKVGADGKDGAKAGGVIGFLREGKGETITDCSAKNVTVNGVRDIGGIVGCIYGDNTVTGNTCEGVIVNQIIPDGYDDGDTTTVGAIYGRNAGNSGGNLQTNTSNGVKLNKAPVVIAIDSTKTQEEKQAALTNAITNAKAGDAVKIVLPEGTFTLGAGAAVESLIVVGAKDANGNNLTKIDNAVGTTNYKTLAARNVLLENVDIVGRSSDANPDASTACGWAHNGNITYKNCHFTGSNSFFNYNGEQNIIDCTFDIDTTGYPVWVYGDGTYNISGCTFNTIGKAIKIYSNNHTNSVNISNCVFNASTAEKAAVELDQTGVGAISATIRGCTMSGSFTTLYNNKGSNPKITVTAN